MSLEIPRSCYSTSALLAMPVTPTLHSISAVAGYDQLHYNNVHKNTE